MIEPYIWVDAIEPGNQASAFELPAACAVGKVWWATRPQEYSRKASQRLKGKLFSNQDELTEKGRGTSLI